MGVWRATGVDDATRLQVAQALCNRVLGKATLAVATTVTRVQITNQTDFCIAGKVYRKAATDNISVGALTNTAALQGCRIRVEINSAGTVTFGQGPVTQVLALAPVPRRTANLCTLGWIDVPASFTFGTTSFAAAGVVFTDGDPDLGDISGGVPPNDRGIDQTAIRGSG